MNPITEPLDEAAVRTEPRSRCRLCGGTGALLYEGLADRQYRAPGTWNIRRCQQAECGLLWLDPAPLEPELSKFYASYYTHDLAGAEEGRLSFAARLRWFVKFGRPAGGAATPGPALRALSRATGFVFPPLIAAAGAKGGRLLDVGCGRGDLVQAAQELGWDAEGLDSDPVAVASARHRGWRISLGSIAGQQYPADHFDVIVMSHVIEHLADPVAVLEQCHRILKPGGRLVLATPNVESQFHRKFGRAWLHLDPPRHLFLFARKSLHALVRRAGFERPAESCSVLGAPNAYECSELIARHGNIAEARRLHPGIFVLGSLMMLLELARVKSGRFVGEELRLVVAK